MESKSSESRNIMDYKSFLKLLPTLSLHETLRVVFRRPPIEKWENLVVCKDLSKTMYECNICYVVQYGVKNLFSHLHGKKHLANAALVKQVHLPKEGSETNQCKDQTKTSTLQTNNKISIKTLPLKPLQKQQVSLVEKNSLSIEKMVSIKKKIPSPSNNSREERKSTTNSTPESTSKEIGPNRYNFETISVLSSNPNTLKHDKRPSPPKAPMELVSPIKEKVVVQYPTESSIPVLTTTMSKSLKKKLLPLSTKTHLSPKLNMSVVNSKEKTIDAGTKTADRPTDKEPHICIKEKLQDLNTNSQDINNKPKFQNIVKNPLSKKNSKQIISCVPISKLLTVDSESKINKEEPTPPKSVTKQNTITKITLLNDIKGGAVDPPVEVTSEVFQVSSEFNQVQVLRQRTGNTNRTETEKNVMKSNKETFDSSECADEIFGLIGVEYVVKIVRNINDKIPRFECSLCEILLNETNMQKHLTGYGHRLKYCEKHFPTAIRQYRQYMSKVPEHEAINVMMPILEKLAVTIEKHHGRETPFNCYEYNFNKSRQDIFAKVFNRRHASEMHGPAFTHVIDSKDVDILIENRKSYRPHQSTNPGNSSANFDNPRNIGGNVAFGTNYISSYLTYSNVDNFCQSKAIDDETHKRLVEKFLNETKNVSNQSNLSSHGRLARDSKRERSRSNSFERKKLRTSSPSTKSQWNVERKSLSPLRDGDIWQAYRHLVDQKVRELNLKFDLYRSDPEEHPLYDAEWQKFWKRRKDELILAGINHKSYNYQNEWIVFFNARLKELYNEEVEIIKIQCRERLCLPMTNTELSNPKYHVQVSSNISSYEKNAVHSDVQKIEKDIEINRENKEESSRSNVNVIHVLRLLTALEEYLGSLGPYITEMLAKALQVDKLYPNKLNDLILTSENCTILETAKEKFTGLILSKILDSSKERILNKAIQNTEMLLKYAAKIKKVSRPNELTIQKSEKIHNATSNGTSIPSSKQIPSAAYSINKQNLNFDKTDLAAKLASSLISQGKTNLDHEQLQQIIQVYSLIEKNKNKIIKKTPVTSTATLKSCADEPLRGSQVPQSSITASSELTNHMPYHGSVTNPQISMLQPYEQMQNTARGQNCSSNFPKAFMMNNMQISGNYASETMARSDYQHYNQMMLPPGQRYVERAQTNSNSFQETGSSSSYYSNNHDSAGSNRGWI